MFLEYDVFFSENISKHLLVDITVSVKETAS